MKKGITKIITIIFVAGIIFNSCTEDFKPDSSTAKDNVMLQNILIEIFELVSNNTVSNNTTKLLINDSSCYSKTIDTLDDGTFRLTITFDKEDCEFDDG